MCTGLEVAAYAALAVSAASAYVSYEQQQDAAEENRKAAARNYEQQMAALQEERTQINQQAGEKMSEIAKIEQAKMAQLRVAAGESGVSGVSLGRIENEIDMNASQDMASIEANRKNAVNQTTRQAAASAAQAINQANSVRKPYWGATALQIAGSGLSTYNSYQNAQRLDRMTTSTSTSGVQTGGG